MSSADSSGKIDTSLPEGLAKGLRLFWDAVFEAEKTADTIVTQKHGSTTEDKIFQAFTQLTPEFELVPYSAEPLWSQRKRRRKIEVVTGNGLANETLEIIDSDSHSSSSINGVKNNNTIPKRQDSPELVFWEEDNNQLCLEWDISYIGLLDKSTIKSERIADSLQVRQEICSSDSRLKETKESKLILLRKLFNADIGLLQTDLAVECRGLHSGIWWRLMRESQQCSVDHLLRQTACPICYREFRDIRVISNIDDTNETTEIMIPKCGHALCSACVVHLTASSGTKRCPHCRERLGVCYPLKFTGTG